MSLSDRLSSARKGSSDEKEAPAESDELFDAFDLYHNEEMTSSSSVIGKVKKLFGRGSNDTDAAPDDHSESAEAATPQPVFDVTKAFKTDDELGTLSAVDNAATHDAAVFADMTADSAPDDASALDDMGDMGDMGDMDDMGEMEDEAAPSESKSNSIDVTDPIDPGPTAKTISRKSGASAAAAAAVSATALLSEQVKADQFWSPYADDFDALVLSSVSLAPTAPMPADAVAMPADAVATAPPVEDQPVSPEPVSVEVPETPTESAAFDYLSVKAPAEAEAPELEAADTELLAETTADPAVVVPQPAVLDDAFPLDGPTRSADSFEELMSIGVEPEPEPSPGILELQAQAKATVIEPVPVAEAPTPVPVTEAPAPEPIDPAPQPTLEVLDDPDQTDELIPMEPDQTDEAEPATTGPRSFDEISAPRPMPMAEPTNDNAGNPIPAYGPATGASASITSFDDIPVFTEVATPVPVDAVEAVIDDPAGDPAPSPTAVPFDELPYAEDKAAVSFDELPYAEDNAAVSFDELPYTDETLDDGEAPAPETPLPVRSAPVLPPAPMLDEIPADGLVPNADAAHVRPQDSKGGFFKRQHERATATPAGAVDCPSCGSPTDSELIDEANGVRHFSCDQCFKIWEGPLG